MDKTKFILVESEGVLLSTLQKMIERIFKNAPVFACTNSYKAFETIKNKGENSIIIVNIKLPDINGIRFLEKIKEYNLTNFYYIISLSNEGESIKIKALREGASDFIYRPYKMEDLIPAIRNAYNHIESNLKVKTYEEKYLNLKESFDSEIMKLKDILDYIISNRIPDAKDEIILIEEATKWICIKLLDNKEAEDLQDILNAAKLIKTGRVILNDKLINEPVMSDGRLTSPEMKLIPETNFTIYSKIKGYEKVSELLNLVYENFDGTGFPEGKKSWEIPVGSRILRVVSDYYDILKKEKNSEKTMDKILNEVKRLYDFNVVAYLDQYLAETNKESQRPEITREIYELDEGLTLSRNIFTKEGFVLLGKGTQLNTENLNKLKMANHKEGIVGKPYIYDIATKEERDGIK